MPCFCAPTNDASKQHRTLRRRAHDFSGADGFKRGTAHRGLFEMFHSFFVEERMSGGNMTRVVRGIKQDWMVQDYGTNGGDIV